MRDDALELIAQSYEALKLTELAADTRRIIELNKTALSLNRRVNRSEPYPKAQQIFLTAPFIDRKDAGTALSLHSADGSRRPLSFSVRARSAAPRKGSNVLTACREIGTADRINGPTPCRVKRHPFPQQLAGRAQD